MLRVNSMIMKRISEKIKNYTGRRRKGKAAFLYAKKILKKGVYAFSSYTDEFFSIKKKPFHFRNLLFLYVNGNSHRIEKKGITSVTFNSGLSKFIVMTDDVAYGFYLNEESFSQAKENYIQYHERFNYPHIQILSFLEDQKCVMMEKLQAPQIIGDIYDRLIVKKLLTFHADAATQTGSDGEIYFLQHGDAKRANILQNGEDFCFVDLDGLQFYPPLFDVFHYLCTAGYDLKTILEILEENRELLAKICETALLTDPDIFDNLLYRYVDYYVKTDGDFYDFRFLTQENTVAYPKTNSLLQSLSENRPI